MRIAEEKIEQVRQSSDIVDVISGYVQLKKRGRNFIGLCPFHQEKTPSFTVSPDKQIYHCFGCHAGGNVFGFLMEFKNISFVESVQELAAAAGITIDEGDSESSAKNTYIEELYDLSLTAARHFSDNLFNKKEGKGALSYLKDRGIKPKTQKNFGLGYALPGWRNLTDFIRGNNLDIEKSQEIGLVDRKEGSDYYDKFRDRVIFPIFSTNGRVIAFGGRILSKQDNVAKYLNSPESPIYSKRKVLYGLFHSKEEIRKQDKAILVEGYMDLISLFQKDVKNVVASSGTALTEEQVVLLSRFTKNIIVLFDADEAGAGAAMRSIEVLLKHSFDVKIMSLPEGEDPDSFINKYGKKDFEDEAAKAVGFLEYQLTRFEKQGLLADPDKASDAIREVVSKIALIDDEIKQELYIKDLSRKFNLREKLLEKELEKISGSARERENRPAPRQQEYSENGTTPVEEKKVKQKADPVEKDIIKLLFEGDEEITGYIFDNVHPDDFITDAFREAANIIYECYGEDIILPASILERVEDERLRSYLYKLTLSDYEISQKKWKDIHTPQTKKETRLKQTRDIIHYLNLRKVSKRMEQVNEEISRATEEEIINELFSELMELQEEKKNLLLSNSNLS